MKSKFCSEVKYKLPKNTNNFLVNFLTNFLTPKLLDFRGVFFYSIDSKKWVNFCPVSYKNQ